MKIVVTGAGGYISRNLIEELRKLSYEVITLSRKTLYSIPELKDKLSGTDVVIHLAGAPVLQRWTNEAKAEILNSRTVTTQNLTKAVNLLPDSERPRLFISASAIGIYAAGKSHSEESTLFEDDFISQVVSKWEDSSNGMPAPVRKVIFRIGLVLGREAKTIKQLLPVFKSGLGGKIGAGKQPFPFIHVHDVIHAILWAINNPDSQGIYNLVAPENINNIQFTKTLANLLHRPAIFTVPAIALKIIYGEASSLILKNPVVFPKRLTDAGYKFSFPDIHSALSDCIKKPC